MAHTDTKKRILDAAEKLFAQQGFYATSLRMLTKEAGVNLAAVNYHFGSKEELIKAVFGRRMLPLNKMRLERLQNIKDSASAEGRPPDIKEILLAFIEPTFEFRKSGKGAQDFISMISRAFSDPRDTVRKLFLNMVEPVFQLLFELLCEALPSLPKNIVYWRLNFMIGAMAHAMSMSQMCQLIPDGLVLKVDSVSLAEQFVNFVANGLEAPL
ncbi:MAG: TetR/AcrR family transcriptional regulator [Thermodesulfobacteriota bacterium]